MPRYIVLKMQEHTTDSEAEEFAQEINKVFAPHYDAYVAECDSDPKAFKSPYVKCDRCGNTWDTINPCALCNATY